MCYEIRKRENYEESKTVENTVRITKQRTNIQSRNKNIDIIPDCGNIYIEFMLFMKIIGSYLLEPTKIIFTPLLSGRA